jgi:hypothetical protein
MKTTITLKELHKLICKALTYYHCNECLWQKHKCKMSCSVAMVIRMLIKEGYLKVTED